MTAAKGRGRPRDAGRDEAILQAAGELFMAHGFDAVSMDAVARAAGVSKPTIYARWPDKDALFQAVLRQKCEAVLTPDSFELDLCRPVRDCLIGIAERFLNLVLSPEAMAMHKVIVAEVGRAPRVAELFFEAAVLRCKDQFVGWLEGETRAGRLKVRDPEGAAWRYLGAVKGEAHMRAAFSMAPLEPARLRAHVEACADDFLRAHAAN